MSAPPQPEIAFDQVAEHVKGLKIHAMISGDLDADHHAALSIPLGMYRTINKFVFCVIML